MPDKIRVLFTKDFWLDAIERAIKAAAASAVSFFTVGVMPKVELPWQNVLTGAGIAALASVLLAVASAPVDGTVSPASLLRRK